MAITYKLTDGTTEVDLTSSSGFQYLVDGAGNYSLMDEMGIGMSGDVLEDMILKLTASGHDNAATQLQTLNKLLKKAYDYFHTNWQTTPVYLEAKTSGETNSRYALVKGVKDVEHGKLYDMVFSEKNLLLGFRVGIIREHPWRSFRPGNIGTSIASGHIANYCDDVEITNIKLYDNGTGYSDISLTGGTLFPSTVAQSDAIIVGSTIGYPKAIIFPTLKTAGNFTSTDWVLKYKTAASYGTLTLGEDYLCFPEETVEECFEQTDEDIAITIKPPSDWVVETVDSVEAYWVWVQENDATPSYSARPVLDDSTDVYCQKEPYMALGSAVFGGDSPMKLMLRLKADSGGGTAVGFGNISRILIGTKSRGLDNFSSHLNAGGYDMPTGWEVAQLTDAAAVANPEAPGGYSSTITFAGTSSLTSRIQFQGTSMLSDYEGEYLAFLRCQQSGGSIGDIGVQLRTFLYGTSLYDPHVSTPEVYTHGVDEGYETLDLGLLSLPFTETHADDDLENVDVIFQLLAERTSGSSYLDVLDLILLPVDEAQVGADDPVSDLDYGSSALRGKTALDIDSGLIDWRAQKQIIDAGGTLHPSEAWVLMQKPIELENLNANTRLYFLLEYYPTAWDSAPLVSTAAQHLSVEVFAHKCYSALRGSD